MPNKTILVRADLTEEQRQTLIDAFPPLFDNMYARQLVWAYGVPADFAYSKDDPCVLTLTGHHVGAGHEALVGHVHRTSDPDTLHHHQQGPTARMLHITLSTDDGVPPGAAGDIDPASIRTISPIILTLHLIGGHAKRLQPQRRAC